jgi:hypothetical protein
MQITFLNHVRKVGRLVLSRTSCLKKWPNPWKYVFSNSILDCWIGIIGSAVLSDKLSILENLLHLFREGTF